MEAIALQVDPEGSWFSEATPIKASEVHVWSGGLDTGDRPIEMWKESLSPQERQRADRFHFPKDRADFVIARSLLRILLGKYLSIKPKEIQFEYTSFGKPRLHHNLGQDALRFNLSHSHGQAMYAFTQKRELGIDLEHIPHAWNDSEIPDCFFSDREAKQLLSLSGTARKEAFFRCWVRKEAYIKARGEGLSFGLDHFDVSLLPGEPPALLEVRTNPSDVNRWSMKELIVDSCYSAALVAEGFDWNIRYFRTWGRSSIGLL